MHKLIVAILVVVAFVGGRFLGQDNTRPTITSSIGGASYDGGYDLSKDALTSAPKSVAIKLQGKTLRVNEGELIMDVVQQASPGDTILVMPGTYSETIYIDKDNIRLMGVIQEGKRAVLDGLGRLNDAILYSGNNIVVENFLITKYKGNAVMGQAGNNFEIRNNIIEDTGVYGIFPQLGKNGIVEHNIVSGIEDAAIYIGMSENVHVAHNHVFDSVAGIEVENSSHVIVENNFVTNNTGGVLAFITPGLPIKTAEDIIIRNNWIHANNHKNFGAPGSLVAGIPAGSGVVIMAADDVVIEDNIITGNKMSGIAITDHTSFLNVTTDPESDPNPDGIKILNNLMYNNGYDTIDEAKALLLASLKQGNPDILKVGKSHHSCIINRHRYISVGVDEWKECDFVNTNNIESYLLDEPVPPRNIKGAESGKVVYLGVCMGCHTYTGRMIGPPIKVIQALYMDNPQGIADYIAAPVKKRDDYPEMPPQNYLDAETRLAVANYLLKRKN